MMKERDGKEVESAQLATTLKGKRWFGDKGAEIRDVTLRDVIPITWAGARRDFAVGRADVTTDTGRSTYQLFLVPGEATADALEHPEFLRGLADAFLTGASFERGDTRWIVESESKTPLAVPIGAPITIASAEQSNTSVILNREAILKLYRRIEPGIHPEVEVTRFLTLDHLFVHVPIMLGTIRFEDASGVTIAGMLQEYVQGAVDGWTHALASSRQYCDAQESQDPAAPFAEDAEEIGTITRALHAALASGTAGSGFDMQPATKDDVRRWAGGAVGMIERATASLERAIREKALPGERRDEAQAIVDRKRGYVDWMTELASGIDDDAGSKTRTHGDYHLGQLLRPAAKRFLIIDFEGEPLHPLKERRAHHSPLRDVAGMLRSFAYAAGAGSGATDKMQPKPSAPNQRGEARAARWERLAREAFLRGYFGGRDEQPPPPPSSLMPRSQNNAGRLIALFEAEKAFYELQYELDHRPDWAWIPLRGIAKLDL